MNRGRRVVTCPAGRESISRYIGLAKTHLQHVLTAAAVTTWFGSRRGLRAPPIAETRCPRFFALQLAA